MAGPVLNPLRHLLCCRLAVSEHENLVWSAEPLSDKIGGLGNDDAGLTRACCRQHPCRIFVGYHRLALLPCKGNFFDSVEKRLHARNFLENEGLIRRRPKGIWLRDEPIDD